MVCIYCHSSTSVNNSRLQKRSNSVWRRRNCEQCGNTFTTHEKIDLEAAIRVRTADHKLQPLSRDHLFLSLYESCKHRPSALEDADGLTDTVISLMLQKLPNGVIGRTDIVITATNVLQRFDKAAATMYQAYHQV
jgi:transcriptional repressor NrdR